jgi:hypothetical protein
MTIRRMGIACWITKATDTHSEYVILVAFLRQQWSQQRASMLRHTCIAYLVITQMESVHCAVRPGFLKNNELRFVRKELK